MPLLHFPSAWPVALLVLTSCLWQAEAQNMKAIKHIGRWYELTADSLPNTVKTYSITAPEVTSPYGTRLGGQFFVGQNLLPTYTKVAEGGDVQIIVVVQPAQLSKVEVNRAERFHNTPGVEGKTATIRKAYVKHFYYVTWQNPSCIATISTAPEQVVAKGGGYSSDFFDWQGSSCNSGTNTSSTAVTEKCLAVEMANCYLNEPALIKAWAIKRDSFMQSKETINTNNLVIDDYSKKYCVRFNDFRAIIRTPQDSKKWSYRDLQQVDSLVEFACQATRNNYTEAPNQLRFPGRAQYEAAFRQALQRLDAVLAEYVPATKQARINDEVAANIWYNKAQILLLLNDWEAATKALAQARTFKNIGEGFAGHCETLEAIIPMRKAMYDQAPKSQQQQIY